MEQVDPLLSGYEVDRACKAKLKELERKQAAADSIAYLGTFSGYRCWIETFGISFAYGSEARVTGPHDPGRLRHVAWSAILRSLSAICMPNAPTGYAFASWFEDAVREAHRRNLIPEG